MQFQSQHNRRFQNYGAEKKDNAIEWQQAPTDTTVQNTFVQIDTTKSKDSTQVK